jgi:hypothetical protein
MLSVCLFAFFACAKPDRSGHQGDQSGEKAIPRVLVFLEQAMRGGLVPRPFISCALGPAFALHQMFHRLIETGQLNRPHRYTLKPQYVLGREPFGVGIGPSLL